MASRTARVNVRLFGALREGERGRAVEVEVDEGAGLTELRAALVVRLGGLSEIVQDSAFASESEILHEGWRVSADCSVAALPPVCGG